MDTSKGPQVSPSAAPAPSQLLQWTSRRPSASSSRAHARAPWHTVAGTDGCHDSSPLVGVECRAASGDVVRNQVAAGLSVRMVADPQALLARVARDHTDDGRDDRSHMSRALWACWRVAGADPSGQDEACFFSPAFWYSSSASKAVPHITAVGAVFGGLEYAAAGYGAVP